MPRRGADLRQAYRPQKVSKISADKQFKRDLKRLRKAHTPRNWSGALTLLRCLAWGLAGLLVITAASTLYVLCPTASYIVGIFAVFGLFYYLEDRLLCGED